MTAFLLCAVHFMLPQLRILTKLLMPLPVALSYILFGPTVVLGLFAGGCLLLLGFVSLEQTLGFAAGGAMLGLILGEYVRRGLTPFRTIAAGTLAVSVVTLISLQLAAPGSVIPGDEAAFNSLFVGNLPAEKNDVFEQLRASIGEEGVSRAVRWTMLVLPSLVMIGELFYVIVGFLALRALIRRLFGAALFEATHGTAPKYANLDKVNPSSLILSGVMMFEHLGWTEVSETITSALVKTFRSKTVTYDFARLTEGATEVKCSEFARAVVDNL